MDEFRHLRHLKCKIYINFTCTNFYYFTYLLGKMRLDSEDS